MAEHYNIQYLTQQQIDKDKWDACITYADNGLIYGYSYYLDHMSQQWDGLILNDYEAVMPLTWNKKYRIHYLYQPFLTAQAGVFGKNISPDILQAFLLHIPAKFQYWDIYLNQRNVFPLEDFHLYQRTNYVLDLNKSYGELYKDYRENIQRNIRRAEQMGCKPIKDFDIAKVVTLAAEQMKSHSKESKENIDRFLRLYAHLYKKQQAITYGILSVKDDLIASCVFIFSHNRAYYILVGNHPDGRTVGASHALIDSFIKDHAEKNMLLDFEGSDIRNLAFFYSSFGAKEEKYAAIKKNNLPFYLRWMKK